MTRNKIAAAGTAVLALAALAGGCGTASAQPDYRPLTVAPHAHSYYVPPPAYNPYRGPGALVTAPTHFAGTLAILPFRAINSVFPPRGNTPLTLVGAPVYAAGQLVALPFRMVESAFGGPSPFVTY